MATDQFLTQWRAVESDVRGVLDPGFPDPKGKDRFIRLALKAVQRYPQCTVESRIQCIWDAAMVELELGTPDHLAWLIPYKTQSGSSILQFQVGYLGLIKRLVDAKACVEIHARIVHEADDLVEIEGSIPRLEHRPGKLNHRGPMTGAYAIATLSFMPTPAGQIPFTTWEMLDLAEIEGLKRAAARVQNRGMKFNGPVDEKFLSPAWRDFHYEMVKKGAIKRLGKRLPGDRSDIRKLELLNNANAMEERNYDFTQRVGPQTSLEAVAEVIPSIEDEGPQNDIPMRFAPPPPEPPPDPPISAQDVEDLEAGLKMLGYRRAKDIDALVKELTGHDDLAELRRSEMADFVTKAQQRATEHQKQ